MKQLRPHQVSAHEQLRAKFRDGAKRGLLVIPTGGGKCLGRGTPVMMFDGTARPVETVRVGDRLMGPDSMPRRVMSLARGREAMYRVTPTKGEPYTVNESHVLSLKLTPDRPGAAVEIVNVSVREYLGKNRTFKHRAKGWRAGLDFAARPISIEPYFLGLWLGDGSSRSPSISKPDPEVLACVQEMAKAWGMTVRTDGSDCPTHHITSGEKAGGHERNSLLEAMRAYGLSPAKIVPQEYKLNNRQVRMAVLAGILDADGHHHHGGYDFINKDPRLADDVCWLARSLGLAAYLKPCQKSCQDGFTGDYFRVSISGNCAELPLRIPRKKATERLQKKDVLVTGITVEPIGEDDYFGFEIDGDHLFLLGDFTVTHNTVTALEMLKQTANRGKRGLFLCDRRVLVAQAAREAREYGIWAGVVMADAPHGFKVPDAPIQFASKDTLIARMKRQDGFWDELPPADLIVTDECHRSMAETWEALHAHYPAAFEVGLTATAARGDGKGLGRRYEFLVAPTSYSELIAAGVLTPAKCFSPQTAADDGPKKKRKPKRSELVGDVVGWWQRLAAGRRTFVFASSVKHSMAMRDQFREAGITAEHLDGDTPDDERDAVLGPGGRLATGETLVVCSCSVLKYGVDCPSVGCVQIVDGFGSLVDYLQACGRGLRASPGKEDCVVIDHAGAVLYHGFPDADRHWTLDDATDMAKDYRDKMASGEAPRPVVCPTCNFMYTGRPSCPSCGWKPPRPAGEEVATDRGQLFEVDRATMYAWRQEDFERGWRDAVYAAAHGGRTLGAAAGIFSRKYGVPPWRLSLPTPDSPRAWKEPAKKWAQELFAKQGAA